MGPYIFVHSNLMLPPRTLAILKVHIKLRGNPQKQTYDIKLSSLLSDQYLSMVVTPAIHITPNQSHAVVPFVLVNLSTESIFQSKNENLGFLAK